MNSLYYEKLVLTDIDEEQYETVREYYDVFLSDLNGQDVRNIAIISNRICERKGHKYLKIVGLDIFTGKIVSLIDNHGKNYGLCSYSEDCAKLKSKMVIKVPVELCENVIIQDENCKNIKLFNVLKIKGKYEVLGATNWFNLNEKYRELFYSTHDETFKALIKPISVFKVFDLFKNFENASNYITIHFYGTHYIKTENSTVMLYNPETGKCFDFISSNKRLLDNKGKYLEGTVIAKITIVNNKISILIEREFVCKYYKHSRAERDKYYYDKMEKYYEEDEKSAEEQMKQGCFFVDDRDYIYEFSDSNGDFYSDKYRAYESMEEYCDEYEEYREYIDSNENLYWSDDEELERYLKGEII